MASNWRALWPAPKPWGAAPYLLALAAAVMGLGADHAAAQSQPAWDTPVPAQFQASYKAFLEMKAKANGGTQKTVLTVPDWSGVWTRGPGGLKFDPAQPGSPADGKITAQLTPEADAKYRKKLADVAKGVEWDQLSYCLPAGFPRILTEPFLREFVDTPKETWLINEQQSEVRRVYTDGRGHVPDDEAFALWEGDSIGFWDGDTLVIETVGISGQSIFDEIGTPHSDQLKVTERLHWIKNKKGQDALEDLMTFDDPIAYTKPWVGRAVLAWRPDITLTEYVCEENNRNTADANGKTTAR